MFLNTRVAYFCLDSPRWVGWPIAGRLSRCGRLSSRVVVHYIVVINGNLICPMSVYLTLH